MVVTADADPGNAATRDVEGEVVTITATNPGGGASDGGIVIVTQTVSQPTTDGAGEQSYVIATKTRHVRITYVTGTQTQTAEGALQTDNAAGKAVGSGMGLVAGAVGWGVGGVLAGVLAI